MLSDRASRMPSGSSWSSTSTQSLADMEIMGQTKLGCNDVCLSCAEIDTLSSVFAAASGLTFSDSSHFHQMFANWLSVNTIHHFNPLQLKNFMLHCDTAFGGIGDSISLCATGFDFPDPDTLNDCMEVLTLVATANAQAAYQEYIDSVRADLHNRYLSKCIQANNTELYDMIGLSGVYQITLYYYDQSGLLVKTVPPAGVDKLNNAEVQNVASARASNNVYRPDHTLVTKYRYNTLNGLIWQESPDGGHSDYWYDGIGRLVLSQNAQQALENNFSYTLYDRNGRITEVGQLVNPDSNGIDLDSVAETQTSLKNWLETGSRVQITRSFYDDPMSTEVNNAFGGSGQENLRLRVASTAYYDSLACQTCYSYASHFSYDVHGNVNHMIQDIKPLDMVGHRFKHIKYEYDLISGSVREVNYQEDETDGFHHRYYYDDDNRLTEVETSPQKDIWSTDAHYYYYDHGPLARIEHGEYQVQGEDLAYTINGWIKGSNSTSLDSTWDMGSDADTGFLSSNSNIHKWFGSDEVSYSLGYYDGDYSAIGGSGADAWLAAQSGSGLIDSASQLFNGNIGQMITNWGAQDAQAMAYTYDQLNRLVVATAFQNLNATTNSWGTGGALSDYGVEIAYDANGNITSLDRNGYGGTPGMDEMSYHYIAQTNQLEYVDDNSAYTSNYNVDIDDQFTGNYNYNAIGQLIKDSSERAVYDWNVYGKINAVNRSGHGNEAALRFAYDPQGNRTLKTVIPRTSGTEATQLDWDETWYVRDVRGNIMATYGSSYESTGTQGAYACGYAVLIPDITTMNGDSVQLTINGMALTHPAVAWNSGAFSTACDVATAINNYSTLFSATCSRDTIYICANSMTMIYNGYTIGTGSNHHPMITVSSGNLSGGIDHTLQYNMTLAQDEHHIYGSNRLGVSQHVGDLSEVNFQATIQGGTGAFASVATVGPPVNFDSPSVNQTINFGSITGSSMQENLGLKTYEYTNHLGNVLLTTNDKRLPIDNNTDNVIDAYSADVRSYSDYYPYGMLMVGRNSNISDYRFGYQGSEMDNEHKGNGNSYTTYFRQHDPRLGRWFAVDPVTQPWQSPYTSMDCNPIWYNDILGDNIGGPGKIFSRTGKVKPNGKRRLKMNLGKPRKWAGISSILGSTYTSPRTGTKVNRGWIQFTSGKYKSYSGVVGMTGSEADRTNVYSINSIVQKEMGSGNYHITGIQLWSNGGSFGSHLSLSASGTRGKRYVLGSGLQLFSGMWSGSEPLVSMSSSGFPFGLLSFGTSIPFLAGYTGFPHILYNAGPLSSLISNREIYSIAVKGNSIAALGGKPALIEGHARVSMQTQWGQTYSKTRRNGSPVFKTNNPGIFRQAFWKVWYGYDFTP